MGVGKGTSGGRVGGGKALVVGVVCSLMHGAFVASSWPPLGWWALTVLSPLPLLYASSVWATNAGARRWLLRGVYLGSLPLWFWLQRWVVDVSAIGYPLLAMYLAIWPAAFVGLAGWARSRTRWGWILIAPLTWGGLEALRGEIIFTGYPWYLAAQPLIDWPLLSGPGTAIGTYGVGALLLTFCGAVADGLGWATPRTPRLLTRASPLIVTVVWLTLGFLLRPSGGIAGVAESGFDVAVVQTGLPQSNKNAWTPSERDEAWRRWAALTREAAESSPDLIVWPETMFPGYTLDPEAVAVERGAQLVDVIETATGQSEAPTTRFYDAICALQREIGVPMLVGALDVEGFELVVGDDMLIRRTPQAMYNGVFLIENGEVSDRVYHKVERTPFGEFIPYVERWSWVEDWLAGVGAGANVRLALDAGSSTAPFDVELGGAGRVALSTPICFEITKGGLIRRLVEPGPEALPRVVVNVSNDGWFGEANGRSHHLLIARWRCFELGVPLIRAVNTGISAAIDAKGRLLERGPGVGREGLLLTSVTPAASGSLTIYARGGWIVGWALLAGLAALLAVSVAIRQGPPDPRTGGDPSRTEPS